MNTRQSNQRGFTLLEMMLSLTAMLIITISIFSIIVAEQSTHLTEGRKLDMNQGARVIEQMLSEGFRSAGAVLALAKRPEMLGVPTIPFNGIYPLNKNNYPDGVILAAGDPLAKTRLTAPFTNGNNEINVMSVNLPFDPSFPLVKEVAWHANDYGLIMRSDGYYVFRVTTTPVYDALNKSPKLAVRTTAAYYSGLLSTANYIDNSPSGLGTYLFNSPVVRLEYFNIFLVRTETDDSRTLTLTTDCEGIADFFANTSPITETRATPILPNIEDIQIEYIAKVVPPAIVADIWAGFAQIGGVGHPNPCDTVNSVDCTNFYNQFFDRNIASARIFVLLRTEEERNKSIKGSGMVYPKPAMGDVPASILPLTGRYHYTYMQYEVLIRNYNL